MPDDERSTVIRLSRLADYSHSKYGPTWRQLRHCRSLWNGLSSEAQTLCEEAVTLWTDALAAARDEYRHAGGVHDIPDDALRPELVIDPTSDLWTVETAAIAARWEP
ncbi:MAG TPA: hypothetical protein PK659_10465 [Methanothrix sp.]|nr:hypothetical protein [Methanothrix sp.]HOK59208.1 hypothetical protein [Methanothrix sp.]HOL44665.1 hypothetical protein [Methanothrix sp.]HPO89436.1 hypothetical protein [Methanothrix sp.]